MTTYNTGNPLGSSDPRDLFDNAENLDGAVNSTTSDTWVDRLGVTRKTFKGMENDFQSFLMSSGYEDLGAYQSGIQVTARNQIILSAGEYWRVAASTALPYTTTGAGMPEGGAFVSVGDAVLRQNLAAPGGAGLIGNGGIVFDSVADMSAATWLSIGQKVRWLGYYTPGDGGGNTGIVESASGAADGGSRFDLDNGLQIVCMFTSPLTLAGFGVKPDDLESNYTVKIRAAFDYANASKKRLLGYPGAYNFDGITRIEPDYHVDFDSPAGPCRFLGTEAVGSTGRMFRFESGDSEYKPLTLASNIMPGQNSIEVVDASNIMPGDVVRINSTELWPYDNRGTYYRGEIHLVDTVDVVNNIINISDQTRDFYAVADVQSFVAWKPRFFRMRNFEAIAKKGFAAACLQFDNCLRPLLENYVAVNASSWGALAMSCWQPTCNNIEALNINDSNGYGLQDRSCVGMRVNGLRTTNCRRSFDASSLTDANSAVSRDYSVTNFVVNGGPDFWPTTAETSYGIGNHGSSENGQFRCGIISNCKLGINLRGLSQNLSDIDIYGDCTAPIDLTFGCGATGNNVNYYPGQYPNKGVDLASLDTSKLPLAYLNIGRASTNDAKWFFELPVRFTGFSAVGLVEALVYSKDSASELENIELSSFTAEAHPSGGVFNYVRHLSSLNASKINGQIKSNGRDTAICNTNFAQDNGKPYFGVEIDGVNYIRLADDSAGLLAEWPMNAGARPFAIINLDAVGGGLYRLFPASASLTVVSGSGVEATADGAALNGTTGSDNAITVGLTASGKLYAENRTGATRYIRASVIA